LKKKYNLWTERKPSNRPNDISGEVGRAVKKKEGLTNPAKSKSPTSKTKEGRRSTKTGIGSQCQ